MAVCNVNEQWCEAVSHVAPWAEHQQSDVALQYPRSPVTANMHVPDVVVWLHTSPPQVCPLAMQSVSFTQGPLMLKVVPKASPVALLRLPPPVKLLMRATFSASGLV